MTFGYEQNKIMDYHFKNYEWDEIERICETHPDLMRCMLKNTNTPLHEMCNIGSAPMRLMEKILDSWYEATVTRNRHGETPLHIKARNSQYSSSPIRMLIKSNKKAVRMLNNTGKTPLAIACMSGACFSVIQELVVAYPEALSIRDSYGHTPLDLLWSTFAKTLPGASAVSKYLEVKNNANAHGNEMSPLLARFHEKMSFCLRQSCSLQRRGRHNSRALGGVPRSVASDEGDDCLLLCHAIIMGELKHCPHTLLEIFLSHNGKLGYQIDSDGNTALHLQLSKSLDKKCISVLIDKCAECSGITNKKGILPLHTALKRLLERTDGEAVVRKIADANVEALCVRDPFTLFYPFMSAGAAGNLQMTYDFLLKSPNVLLNFIR